MIDSNFSLSNEGGEYSSRDSFIQYFNHLSAQKLGRYLTIGKTGDLRDAHFLEYFLNNLKLLISGKSETRNQLGLHVIQLIEFGVNQGWLKKENLAAIDAIAKRAGIAGGKSRSELNQYIDDLSKEILMEAPHSQEGYLKVLSCFKANEGAEGRISKNECNQNETNQGESPIQDALQLKVVEAVEVEPISLSPENLHKSYKHNLKWKVLCLLSLSIIYVAGRVFSNYFYKNLEIFPNPGKQIREIKNANFSDFVLQDYKLINNSCPIRKINSVFFRCPVNKLIPEKNKFISKKYNFPEAKFSNNISLSKSPWNLINKSNVKEINIDTDLNRANVKRQKTIIQYICPIKNITTSKPQICPQKEVISFQKQEGSPQKQTKRQARDYLTELRIVVAALLSTHYFIIPWLRQRIKERRM